MSSKVYFTSVHAHKYEETIPFLVNKLFYEAGFDKLIQKGDLTAIKTHFGERGNTTFIPPWNIRPIVDAIMKAKGKPFLADTNTLYNYYRKNAVDHLKTAINHGFDYGVIGAPVIIADGLTGRNETLVEINKKHFKSVKIASDFVHADSMIVSSHFKGHMMAGFGGAIKNIAMGCASVAGKKDQHSTRPVSDEEKCTGCGICVEICPVGAIELIEGKSHMSREICIGCGDCIAKCPEKAIGLDWKTEIPEFTERLTEYAYGAWSTKKNKIGFINFLINVTPECDCASLSEETIIRDIGILASLDPVAIDKACFDMVYKAQGMKNSKLKSAHEPNSDKFKDLHEDTFGDIQLVYGEEIGLGTQDYELIELKSEEESDLE